MLWFRKRPEAADAPGVAERIVPAEPPLALDPGLFREHFEKLLGDAEQGGGIESYLIALNAKQHRFAELLGDKNIFKRPQKYPVARRRYLGCVGRLQS